MDNRQFIIPACCSSHIDEMLIPEVKRDQLMAFCDMAIEFIKEGNPSIISQMMLVAIELQEYEKFEEMCERMRCTGFPGQIEVLWFLAAGGAKFKEKILNSKKKE